jgi:competence protein ComEC
MSIIANLLAAPLVAPITIFGFIAAILSPITPWVATLLIEGIRIPAKLIAAIARSIAEFPVLTIHNGAIGFSITAFVVALLRVT